MLQKCYHINLFKIENLKSIKVLNFNIILLKMQYLLSNLKRWFQVLLFKIKRALTICQQNIKVFLNLF